MKTVDIGVIFCPECESTLVDSGFQTKSSLRCTTCENTEKFKIGKVNLPSTQRITLEELIEIAKRDARIH